MFRNGPQGLRGGLGPRGFQGPAAAPFKSPSGYVSVRGMQGALGSQGPRGASAIARDGVQGPKGGTGHFGPQGKEGKAGSSGHQGREGQRGEHGNWGLDGPQGLAGPEGKRGENGNWGLDGAQGTKGDMGTKGEKGDTGAQGPKAKKIFAYQVFDHSANNIALTNTMQDPITFHHELSSHGGKFKWALFVCEVQTYTQNNNNTNNNACDLYAGITLHKSHDQDETWTNSITLDRAKSHKQLSVNVVPNKEDVAQSISVKIYADSVFKNHIPLWLSNCKLLIAQ